MTRKVVDHFMWKANALHQSSDIETAILVCSHTDYANWLDCQQAEGHILSADEGHILSVVEGGSRMVDYAFDEHGALRHKKCGGQIAVEAELYVISGFGFPESPDEVEGCRIERGPRGITITRKFGGYRGYCMKCHREGNFYGPRYHAKRQRRWSTPARRPCQR